MEARKASANGELLGDCNKEPGGGVSKAIVYYVSYTIYIYIYIYALHIMYYILYVK